MVLIHIPNAKHARNVDLCLRLLIPLHSSLLSAPLIMVLEENINSRRRLAGWAPHAGPTTKPSFAEERLDLALTPPSPAPRAPAIARKPVIGRTAAEVSHFDALAAALIPHVVVIREPRKLEPKVQQRGEEGEYDDDYAERDEAPLGLAREVVSAFVEQPAVQVTDVVDK